MGFLKLIGAVSAAEHERLIKSARDEEAATIASLKAHLHDARKGFVDQQAKFKKAIADLANATDTIGDFKIAFDRMEKDRDNWRDQALRDAPDAEKHRAKLDRDRNRVRPSRAKAPTKAVAAKGRASK